MLTAPQNRFQQKNREIAAMTPQDIRKPGRAGLEIESIQAPVELLWTEVHLSTLRRPKGRPVSPRFARNLI
jgi:hypothetical protein